MTLVSSLTKPMVSALAISVMGGGVGGEDTGDASVSFEDGGDFFFEDGSQMEFEE